jgi:hypothetical protein
MFAKAREVGSALGYSYPQSADDAVGAYIEKLAAEATRAGEER